MWRQDLDSGDKQSLGRGGVLVYRVCFPGKVASSEMCYVLGDTLLSCLYPHTFLRELPFMVNKLSSGRVSQGTHAGVLFVIKVIRGKLFFHRTTD